MPIRKRLQAAPVAQVDAVSCFKWSLTGDGLSHALGHPCYSTRAEAQRAWQRVRRVIWAKTARYHVPHPAEVYDGLTTTGLEFVRGHWNQTPPFDLSAAREALAVDRANLARFEATKAARSVRDYLDLFRADLDAVERSAETLAAAEQPRRMYLYPSHLNTGLTYDGNGGRRTLVQGDDA